MKRLKRLSLFIIALIIMLNITVPFQVQASNEVTRIRVYSFYVGKGDCYIIQLIVDNGVSEYVLVDTGQNNKTEITNFIKSKNIKKFKYVILTHYDKDHSYQLKNILENVEVGNYLIRRYSSDIVAALKEYKDTYDYGLYTHYTNVENVIKVKEGNLNKVVSPRKSANTVFDIGNNIEIRFLNKYASYFTDLISEEPADTTTAKNVSTFKNKLGLASNNDSLVFTIRTKNGAGMEAMVFNGDVRPEAMLDYNGDANFKKYANEAGFFTFPHHGLVNQRSGKNDDPDKYGSVRDEYISSFGATDKSAITFVSCPNNAEILASTGNTDSSGNLIGDIYTYFDAIRMRNLTEAYIRTSTLNGYSGQTALKYTVNVSTGDLAVRTYPDNIDLYVP